jgi:hypothetical protein
MRWWHDLILFWADALNIPLRTAEGAAGVFEWLTPDGASQMPTAAIGLGTAAAVILLYACTYWMGDALTPAKYVIRIVCLVQASALLFFMFVPSRFAYTIPGHMLAMLGSGYGVMLAVAALMALGYGLLHIPLQLRLAHTALVLGYFAVMVPHQVVLHALVLQHLSVLFMPLLYLCFGVVFDVMVLVALYSWLVSRVPADAIR